MLDDLDSAVDSLDRPAPPRRRDRPRRLRHGLLVAVVPAPPAGDGGQDRPQLRRRARRVVGRRGDRRGRHRPGPRTRAAGHRRGRRGRRAGRRARRARRRRGPGLPVRHTGADRRARSPASTTPWPLATNAAAPSTGAPTACPGTARRGRGCSSPRSTRRTTRSSSPAPTASARAAHEIVYVNARFEADTGIDGETLVGRSLDVLLPTSQGERARRLVHRGVRRPARGASRELEMVRADGSTYLCEMTVSPIYDERGVLTHWMHTGRDISARRALEDERARFEWMIEQSDSLVAMYDTPRRLAVRQRGDARRDRARPRRRRSRASPTTRSGSPPARSPSWPSGEVREQLNATGRWSGPWVLDNRNTGAAHRGAGASCSRSPTRSTPAGASSSPCAATSPRPTRTSAPSSAGAACSAWSTRLAHRAVEDSVDDVLDDLDATHRRVRRTARLRPAVRQPGRRRVLRTAAVWSHEPVLAEADGMWRRAVPLGRGRRTGWRSSRATGSSPTRRPEPWQERAGRLLPRATVRRPAPRRAVDGRPRCSACSARRRYADARAWSDDEIAAVEQFAHVIANLLQRQRTEATLRADVARRVAPAPRSTACRWTSPSGRSASTAARSPTASTSTSSRSASCSAPTR